MVQVTEFSCIFDYTWILMLIGGFTAKITKNKFKHLLEDLNISKF